MRPQTAAEERPLASPKAITLNVILFNNTQHALFTSQLKDKFNFHIMFIPTEVIKKAGNKP